MYIKHLPYVIRDNVVVSETEPLTEGSIPFVNASGELAEDNANLFWDRTNKHLNIGTNISADAKVRVFTSYTQAAASVHYGVLNTVHINISANTTRHTIGISNNILFNPGGDQTADNAGYIMGMDSVMLAVNNFGTLAAIYGIRNQFGTYGTGGADVSGTITSMYGVYSIPLSRISTNITDIYHVYIEGGNLLGSHTNQYGIYVASSFAGKATNNHGIHTNIPSAAGNWAQYHEGNSPSYFAGELRIGSINGGFITASDIVSITGIAVIKSSSGGLRLWTGVAKADGQTWAAFYTGVAPSLQGSIGYSATDGIFINGQVNVSLRVAGTSVLTITAAKLAVADNTIMYFGSSDDLAIYHNGTNSIIQNITGSLLIKGLLNIENNTTIGVGGIAASNTVLTINGSNTSGWGPYIAWERNSVAYSYTGLSAGVVGDALNDYLIYNQGAQTARFSGANTIIGALAALATNATDGFLYIPSCAGAPTGTPTSKTGKVPLVFDTTNKNFYIYTGGSWTKTTTFS